MRYRWTLFLALLAPVLCCAQIYFPGGSGGNFPGMRPRKTITGQIGGIDPGKIMVRTMDEGPGGVANVLFTVDEKTKVHIDKTKLTLADLKEDDAVMVELKQLKDKGWYATEIVPHPDVLARKQRGGTPDAAPSATELPASPPVEKAEAAGPPVKLGSAPAAAHAPVASPPQRSASPSVAIPALPRGQSGITGTIVALKGDEATLAMPGGQRRTVLVTSVTKIVQAGTSDKLLDEVRVGDAVAVMGDSLDTGLYIAREILVNRVPAGEAPPMPAETTAAAPHESPHPAADSTMAVKSDPDTKALTGTFTGIIEVTSTDTLQVRTADGRLRNVVVTPLTLMKKWNADIPLQGLRKGDEIKVVGDLLDDGGTLARELTVTKAASSR
jgi:hypothetical protein